MTGLPGQDLTDDIEKLLARPAEDRLREQKYRFAQAVVFGLPVLGLAWFGQRLGGEEAGRWSGLLQALLAGWVMYVGAAGMLFEGILLAGRGKIGGNFIAASLAMVLYLLGLMSWGAALLGKKAWPIEPTFPWSVIVIMFWTGAQWQRLSRAGAGRA